MVGKAHVPCCVAESVGCVEVNVACQSVPVAYALGAMHVCVCVCVCVWIRSETGWELRGGRNAYIYICIKYTYIHTLILWARAGPGAQGE